MLCGEGWRRTSKVSVVTSCSDGGRSGRWGRRGGGRKKATRVRRGEAAILLLACRKILRRAFICKTLAPLVSSSRAAPIIASSSASLQDVRYTP